MEEAKEDAPESTLFRSRGANEHNLKNINGGHSQK